MATSHLLFHAAVQTVLVFTSHYDKIPVHTSQLMGQDWINELLSRHDGRFYNELGLNKHIFRQLIMVLSNDAGLCTTSVIEQSGFLRFYNPENRKKP
jgi:hypothetical protein